MLKSFFQESKCEVGCDEAGRGCLAGPVVAAAVILPQDFSHEILNDSKKIKKGLREALAEVVKKQAIAYAIGICSPDEIDEINILNASFLAMHKALDQLKQSFDSILVDGNRFHSYRDIPHHCIIKGDGLYFSIAAASILAKTYRDAYMTQLAADYPAYGWEQNMGYPTTKHREAIAQFGATPHHRKTFQLLPRQLSLFD